jgi:hypothetical protein
MAPCTRYRCAYRREVGLEQIAVVPSMAEPEQTSWRPVQLSGLPCTPTAALRLYEPAPAARPNGGLAGTGPYRGVVHFGEEVHLVELPERADAEAFLAEVLPLLHAAARRAQQGRNSRLERPPNRPTPPRVCT